MVVPVYEREQAGVYYNTAAVIDADGTLPGQVPQEPHPAHVSGFWEKYFFKPGNLGYPVFQTRYATIGVYICYDRHFPEGARAARPERRRDRLQPVGHRRRAFRSTSGSSSSRRTPSPTATSWRCINRVGTEAPWNIGKFYGTRYFVDPRGRSSPRHREDKDELVVGRPGSRHDRGGPAHVAVLPRSPARDLQRPWRSCCPVSLLIKNGTVVTAVGRVRRRRARSRASASPPSARRCRCRPTGPSTPRASS